MAALKSLANNERIYFSCLKQILSIIEPVNSETRARRVSGARSCMSSANEAQ